MFIVLEDRRRQLLHLNVTDHPTTASTAQQIVEAFADRDVAQYLIRDRDRIYGEVRLWIASADLPIQLATKVPVPVALNCFRCSLAFESRRSLGERLLIATKPSIPTMVLGNYATPNQALCSLSKVRPIVQDRLCISELVNLQYRPAFCKQFAKSNERVGS